MYIHATAHTYASSQSLYLGLAIFAQFCFPQHFFMNNYSLSSYKQYSQRAHRFIERNTPCIEVKESLEIISMQTHNYIFAFIIAEMRLTQMDKKWEKFKDLPYITRPGFVLSEQLFPKDIYSNEQHIIIILQSITGCCCM